MGINRRSFLGGAVVAGFLPGLVRADVPTLGGGMVFASAYAERGGYGLALLSTAGKVLKKYPLPDRGHGMAVAPHQRLTATMLTEPRLVNEAWLVHFARRPGRSAFAVDLTDLDRTATFEPPDGRLFYGHGFFSRGGDLLYATENDFDEERGVLGIYDARKGFCRVGELPTGGVGPHEAILLKDGRHAAIANGGIATHPDYPRMKLNLADMRPSVAVVNLKTGDLVARAELPPEWHQVSLRHLAEDGQGQVWIGGQYEGPATDSVPLIFTYRPGEGLVPVTIEPAILKGLNQYVGSVSADLKSDRVALTSPRGGRALVFDASSRKVSGAIENPDICGAVSTVGRFLCSDGNGALRTEVDPIATEPEMAWDNHLTAIAM